MTFKEFSFIDEIKSKFKQKKGYVGIGDDAAVFPAINGVHTLWATDCMVENIHFDLSKESSYDVGWKLGAVNISDMAAMGGVPETALLSIAIPSKLPKESLDSLMDGLRACLDQFSVTLIGGDTSKSKSDLFLNLAIQGNCKQPVLRSGAKPGDLLFVTGALGGSILGRHLKVQPRVAEMQWLAGLKLNAAIDISDGLAGESLHLANQSGCFVTLQSNSIPIHQDAVKLGEYSGRTPLEHALSDGEDFEILFALDPEKEEGMLNKWPFPIQLTKVGEFKKNGPNQLMKPNGQVVSLERISFEHNF